MPILSDPSVPLDNKQLRFYREDGKYTRLSVEEAIAQGVNEWKGWHCSAGSRGLYIDYDGNVWVGNCASAGRNDKNHTRVWDEWIDLAWEARREELFGPFPHAEWYIENTEGGYPLPVTGWEYCEQHIKLQAAIKEEQDIFFSQEYLMGPLYRRFLIENEGWRWFSKKDDVDTTWGLLGSIFHGWQVPATWVKCPYKHCGCGADVIVSKIKDKNALQHMHVTNNGYEGQFHTNDRYIELLDDTPVAVEMNFPIDYQILWDISRNCNFNCTYCWPAVHNNTDKHYDYADIKKTIDRAVDDWADGDVIRWNFGGGEPTLHPKFVDILKYLKNRDQWTMVTTNGSRTPRYWEEARKYLNTVNFSCHFENVNIDNFIKNIEIVAQWHDSHDDDHWIEVKLMTPPGVVELGLETKRRIEDLAIWKTPGANGRQKGAIMLVPIRDIDVAHELVDNYTEEEMQILQDQ